MRQYKRSPKHNSRKHDGSPRLRKRYFDLPQLRANVKSWLFFVFLLLFCAPIGSSNFARNDLPAVGERYVSWQAQHNANPVAALPGATPEPSEEYAAIIASVPDPEIVITPAPTPTPTATPAPEESFNLYAPGELFYEGEGMTISVEQIQEGGLTYFVCDIQLSDVSQFGTAFAGEAFGYSSYETVSDIADRHRPALAINADFYYFHREGIILRNGELFRKQALKSRRHLLIVDKEGNLSALTDRTGKQGLVADDLVKKETLHTFEFGPLLVSDGSAVTLPKVFVTKPGVGYDAPRTAIGQLGDLHYIVIVVEGRRDGYSTGCDLPTLQQLFLKHGARFAFNLDGGGSTTLYFNGEVINMPSSGAQRKVSDIIMFGGTLVAQ